MERQEANVAPSEWHIALSRTADEETEDLSLPPPPCEQPLLATSTASSPSSVESWYTQTPPSLFSFLPSPPKFSTGYEGQYGGLFSSSDALPFSLEEFIDSLGS